jgi:UDP-glucose 4-epimerase
MTADRAGFEAYAGARCLVTGGMGFIGSNIARALVQLGATVTIVDNMDPDQGANRFNLDGIEGVTLREHSIGDEAAMAEAVQGQDYVFNLAGKSSHTDVLESPFADLQANVIGQLVLLEAIRHHAPNARVVYGGTRSIYGATGGGRIAEDQPLDPTEVNSANKAAADLYHIAYAHSHGLSTVCLRLTNIYGPRMLVKHGRQGFINWFVRLAVEGGEIKLFGDGSQGRDLLFIDDTVEAFLHAGLQREVSGTAFNIGSGKGVSLREIAETLLEITGKGRLTYVPFPFDAGRIEIGDYVTDTRKTEGVLGWHATTGLREGLQHSCEYYEAYGWHYL